MASELVKSTNSLPFLKESEKDYWNKLLDSNIRAGTMACMWCMKAQLVKKTSLAFHRWKFVVARESWYGNSSPSKSHALHSSRPASGSYSHSAEKTINHAGNRPVSAVLASAISLVNQLKETDAERDVNTRLFASPSASVKAANAAATSVLEFDSRHGDIPKNSFGADHSGLSGASGTAGAGGGAFPWERRRRAGSHGSIDTENGLFDGFGGSNAPAGEYKTGFDLRDAPRGEGQSAEALAAYNKQRLAYVLRSILPDNGSVGGASGGGGADHSSYAMNLDGTRRSSNKDLSPGYSGEEELNAYLRNALLSQNHDAATRGQILMALSQNMVNKPSSQRNTGHTGSSTANGHHNEHGDNAEADHEVSSRSSLSLLRVSGSNPAAPLNTAAFPRARANSRSGSPNARLGRKMSFEYGNSSGGGNGGSVSGGSGGVSSASGGGVSGSSSVQGSVQGGGRDHDYPYNNNTRPYYTTNTNINTDNNHHQYNPETPDTYGGHRTYPSSASSLRPGGSVSGHSLHSEYTSYTNNTSMHSTSSKKSRVVPGYLMPTNSFRKKQSSASGGAKSGGIGSGRARSPGMITSSTSKHAVVLGSGGTSPSAYTVKGSMSNSGGRSGSAGRGGDNRGGDNRGSGGDSSNGNVFYAANSRATTPNHAHNATNTSTTNTTTNTNTNANTANNTTSNSITSYANMSFLDYQARKANLHSGTRSPVRRNSANIDTNRLRSGSVGGSVSGSVFGEEDGVQVLTFPPMATQQAPAPPQAQVPPLALSHAPLALPQPPLQQQAPLPLPLPLTGTLPLGLSEPALPMALHSQPHPATTAPTNNTVGDGSGGADLVYEVYDTYHNSTLHSNSSDLYEQSMHHNSGNGAGAGGNSTSNVYAPHSPTEHILYNEDMTYYNQHPTHNTHNTHHNTHPTHTHNTSQPFVANATNTLRPAPVTTNSTTNNTTHTSTSGKRSNPNSGGKKAPKGMDKAQLELMMYGDVHGRTPNWHKTLRN